MLTWCVMTGRIWGSWHFLLHFLCHRLSYKCYWINLELHVNNMGTVTDNKIYNATTVGTNLFMKRKNWQRWFFQGCMVGQNLVFICCSWLQAAFVFVRKFNSASNTHACHKKLDVDQIFLRVTQIWQCVRYIYVPHKSGSVSNTLMCHVNVFCATN